MLDTLTIASRTTYTYKYDNQGFRKSKTVNGVTTKYTYNGDKLTYQTDGTTSMYFRYDGDNNITGFRYTKGSTDTEYYYVKNLQGDIIGILDGSGKVVVNYSYDAWGVCEVSGSLASTIGAVNPIRYRGYYYDSESGLYYLMSRYYDAEVGRFINADDTRFLGANGSLLSYNLFLNCDNNAVENGDEFGFYKVKLVNLQGTYKGRKKCIEGIINLILTTSLISWASFSWGADLIKLGVAGQYFSFGLSTWLTVPMVITGFIACTGSLVYATCMAAMVIKAIYYTVKYNKYKIKKGWGTSMFSYSVGR